MILDLSTRFTTAYNVGWESIGERVQAVMASRFRYVVAILVIAFSVTDLLLTQNILTIVEREGHDLSEANPFMAPIVMSWWIWPVRVGIPMIAVVRDLRKQNHSLMVFAALLYGAVVAWNLNIFLKIN